MVLSMLRGSVFKVFMTAVAVLLATQAPVVAGTITQYDTITGDGTGPYPTYVTDPFSQTLTFDKFYKPGYDLVSVHVTLALAGASDGTLTNKNKTASTTFTVTTSVQTSLAAQNAAINTLLGGPLATAISQTNVYNVAKNTTLPISNPNIVDPSNPTGSVDVFLDGTVINLSAFVGSSASDTFDFLAAGNGQADVSAKTPYKTDLNAYAFAGVTVVYEYTKANPHIVPEPSSAVLAAFGVFGLIAVRARRK